MAVQAPTWQTQDGADGEPGVLNLYCQYTSGATGAIPTTLTRSQGFQSVARTGTGVVDFILNAPAFKLLDWSVQVIQATPANTGACESTLVDAVATASSATSCKVTVTFRKNSDFTAVDTADGDIVRLRLTLKTVSLNG
jgi:hypothetical protein